MSLDPMKVLVLEFVSNAPRAKMTFWKKIRIFIYVYITTHITLKLVYEPLSYHGVFDNIVNSINNKAYEDWEPFFRTLVFDRSKDGKSDADWSPYMMKSCVHLGLGGRFSKQFVAEYVAFEARHGLKAFLAFTQSRRFAGTNNGLAGYVPLRARKGDTVAIFYGAEVPFVLRKKRDGSYLLIGECYMHGIMIGEALKNEQKDTVFTLK